MVSTPSGTKWRDRRINCSGSHAKPPLRAARLTPSAGRKAGQTRSRVRPPATRDTFTSAPSTPARVAGGTPPPRPLLVQPLARVQPSRIAHMWPKGLPVQPPLLRLSGADTAARGRLADTGSIPHCAWRGGLPSAAHKRARSGATRLRLSHPASRCHRQGGWWGVAVVALPRPPPPWGGHTPYTHSRVSIEL